MALVERELMNSGDLAAAAAAAAVADNNDK